jgi:hypothetical protein
LAWGLRVVSSSDVYVYGSGLYNFFSNYDQTCLDTENCQDAMVDLESNSGNVYLYNLNTKAATNMVTSGGTSLAKQADNSNRFCQTVNAFLVGSVAQGAAKISGSASASASAARTTSQVLSQAAPAAAKATKA